MRGVFFVKNSSVYKRFEELAMKELNAKKGGLAGFIDAEALENRNVLSTVITSILSKYYTKESNQLLIDDFLDSSLDDIYKGFGEYSYRHLLEGILVNLEEIIEKMN